MKTPNEHLVSFPRALSAPLIFLRKKEVGDLHPCVVYFRLRIMTAAAIATMMTTAAPMAM